MNWLLLALGVAALQSVKDVCIRKSGGAPTGDRGAGMGHALAGAGLFSAVIALGQAPGLAATGWPDVQPGFLPVFLASGTLLGLSTFLYFAALRSSDVSATSPMLAFTPLFMLATSPAMLGERLGAHGAIGVGLIVAGSWLLNADGRHGLLAPFRALARTRGPVMMLGVAAIWSVTANIDKLGVDKSNIFFWVGAIFGMNAVTLTLAGLALGWRPFAGGRAGGRPGRNWTVAAGLVEAVSAAMQMAALGLTLTANVIAVKRLSAVFAVLLGRFVLGERAGPSRLAGAALMVAGAAAIALWK